MIRKDFLLVFFSEDNNIQSRLDHLIGYPFVDISDPAVITKDITEEVYSEFKKSNYHSFPVFIRENYGLPFISDETKIDDILYARYGYFTRTKKGYKVIKPEIYNRLISSYYADREVISLFKSKTDNKLTNHIAVDDFDFTGTGEQIPEVRFHIKLWKLSRSILSDPGWVPFIDILEDTGDYEEARKIHARQEHYQIYAADPRIAPYMNDYLHYDLEKYVMAQFARVLNPDIILKHKTMFFKYTFRQQIRDKNISWEEFIIPSFTGITHEHTSIKSIVALKCKLTNSIVF